jgi:hypothetical protein
MGHNSMGGYDIFSSIYDEPTKSWNTPKNAGYPLNTSHDDVHFSWSADGKRIYFSSIRKEGYGDQDIYYAVIHKEESTEVMVMEGFVTDSLNGDPLGATITVTNKNADNIVGVFTSNNASGKFLIILGEGHYKLKIEADKHDVCEKNLDIVELKGFEIVEKNITLCPSRLSEN